MSIVPFGTALTICENRALEVLKQDILRTLDLRNFVIDYFYENTHLSDNRHDEILSLGSRYEQNAAFLEEVLRSGNIGVFLQALEESGTYANLASIIRNLILSLRSNNPLLQPNRINTNCSVNRKLVNFNHALREITSGGKQCEQKLLNITSSMKRMSRGDKNIYFHMLDAEVAFYRVFYKQEGFQKQDTILCEMELCWRSTKYPENSYMVYLARKGSFLASKGDMETGMEYVKHARDLSDKFQPCKETGMVRYIVVNLLLQSYKENPSPGTKQKIIDEITHSIDHDFAQVVSQKVRDDYIKMMYLKLSFCVLGIGCFCEVIRGCHIQETDIEMAKECLTRIGDLSGQLSKKHRMFYSFTKSTLALLSGDRSLALQQAMRACHIAEQCKFLSEFLNIRLYLETLNGNGIQEQNSGVVLG